MMSELSLHEKLIDIQQRLKVPKDKRNEYSTSKFMYRNLEAIEEAVKPMLAEHKLTLTFEDDILGVEGRVFVKAWAILSDGEKEIRKPALAQHATDKKGMDDAQLTGSCSSYARKYAAGGLFLIDETKDADSMDNSQPARSKVTTVVRDRDAEIKEAETDILARAKKKINEELEKHDYTRADQKKAFIIMVLEKPTVDTIDDCELLMDALDNEIDRSTE